MTQKHGLPEEIRAVLDRFEIAGTLLSIEELKTGHINETLIGCWEQQGRRVRFLHQRINRTVFQAPETVMANLVRVTTHIRAKLQAAGTPDLARRCLTVVPARDHQPWVRDEQGEYWRTFEFVENARSFESAEKPEQAFEAARAFGEFQLQVVDLPGQRLVETIPHFHDTPRRLEALERAVEADAFNRAAQARQEIDFSLKRRSMCAKVLEAMRRGEIPERITHNDTKFNNLLLDVQSGKALCVVDLDTVMPGCALYDFGDLVRSVTCAAREQERDLSKVHMRLPLYEKLLEGYLASAGQFLNPTERKFLAFSGALITLETGMRFLTDFLGGDTYFRTDRPGQNLDRCRTQFRLLESIEQQFEPMQRCLNKFA